MAGHVATHRDVVRQLPEVHAPSFVGREGELAALTQVLAASASVVLIEGEAGIGKTRLLQEFLSSPAGKRAKTLVSLCPPLRQPLTLGPVVDALRQAAGDIRRLRLSALAGALRPLFPEWAAMLPPAPEPLDDAAAARHRVFAAFLELLDRLGIAVLVVEDLHWADEATLEFLLLLTSRQPQNVCLMATFRPEDLPAGSLLPRLSRLAAGSRGLRLSIGPLDVAQTGRLVSSMLADAPVSTELAAFLHERTEGVPLAVEESVRVMRARGDLAPRRGGGWARRHLAGIYVPPTVRDAVLERAGCLSQHAQAILQSSAVLGEPATEATLAAVAGLSGGQARAGMCEVLRCWLLTEQTPTGWGVEFRHVLAARAVYDAIPAPLRRELHLRAGRTLEEADPPPLARLARHFREAGDTGKWCEYAEQAASQAMEVGDQPAAAILLYELIAEAGLPASVAVRLVRRIPLAALNGHVPLETLIRHLRSLVDDAGALTRTERAEAGAQLGRLLVNVNEYEAGMAELERAIPGLSHRPADAAQAMVLLGLPMRTLQSASVHRRWLARGWAVAQDASISDDDRLVMAMDRATALLYLGEEVGWQAAAELPADASNPRQALQVARSLVNTGWAATYWGRYSNARQRVCAGMNVADRYGFPRLRTGALAVLAHLDWLTGDWNGLAERTAALTEPDNPQACLEALLVGGFLDLAVGHHHSGQKKLELVIGDVQQHGWIGGQAEPCAVLARTWLAVGRVEDALALTEEPMRMITAKRIWIWATDIVPIRVQALTAIDRNGDAAELVASFARGLYSRHAPAPKAAVLLCRGLLAEDAGDYRRAAAVYARAADVWQGLPRPYDALLARERQAHCLFASDRHDAGVSLLGDVFQGLSGLGATGDAERITRALHEHGVTAWHRWRGGRRGYGDQLSPRELEVVRLLAEGCTSQQIADTLHRSRNTVNTQISSAIRKLKVSSRMALVARAVEAARPGSPTVFGHYSPGHDTAG